MNLTVLLAFFFGGGPTFYHDVQPILQNRCQACHRPGEIGPMPLISYREVRPYAKAIREAVLLKRMPPWFADPRYGHFANDPSLSSEEMHTLAAWVDAGAPEGNPADASPPRLWPRGWNIGEPDAVFTMPHPFKVPASGDLDYQYIIIPTGFQEDHWVQRAEIRPGDRSVVHHAVVYVREPGDAWLRDDPVGVPFAVPARNADGSLNPMAVTTSDILFTYTPGNGYDEWAPGTAKLIKAGSDLVFQMHYTPAKRPIADQTRIGLVFSKTPPRRRILTLQMANDRFIIPPGVPDFRVAVRGTLPNDALLLSFYPHMHLRGRTFEYAITPPNGQRTILLKVNNYEFYWQLNYKLAEPLPLRAGTQLEFVATFDNSRNNPWNPDPEVAVHYGQRSTDEMMIGFFDVAVDANVDKRKFFERRPLDSE